MPFGRHTVHERRYEPTDKRLGRHVRHDSRSLDYAVGVLPESAITYVKWTRRIPILDQGQIGSCTANALVSALGTDNAQRPGQLKVTVTAVGDGVFDAGEFALAEPFALRTYSLETLLDSYPGQYPPDDTGSDALGAMAAAKALGLVTEYQHAFSVAALQSGLVKKGPAMWGTIWLNSMFDVNISGYLVVDRKSGTAGGHELLITSYDPATDTYGVDNSWGESFGLNGTALVHGSDMKWLLSQDGDVTFPVWAPVTPPGPAPFTDAEFWGYAQRWAAGKGFTS